MSNRILSLLLPLLLTGCLLSPGKFTSELVLLEDDQFTFSYQGEIQMLALTDLAQMEAKKRTEFTATPCYDDETYEDRECTDDELEKQKTDWEELQAANASRRNREAEQMRAVLGGIDPTDPDAANEFASKLERQRNWKSVEYKGNGLFEVDYSVSGKLINDFTFPVIEQMQTTLPFMTVILRDKGQVRIEAPGYAAQEGGDPMTAMLGGGMGLSALMLAEASEEGEDLSLTAPEGTFRIVTNGRILANNTDEGPSKEGRREVLTWEITPRTKTAPMALIGFE
ncbi:hypothetical protein ACRAQ7_00050 [Erythrobacter sp. W53]|uniref:hypothetical protein n=1 Tax=Erythrobacter sp. W53 TaxID=3425947 RepID=UPI003D767BB8